MTLGSADGNVSDRPSDSDHERSLSELVFTGSSATGVSAARNEALSVNEGNSDDNEEIDDDEPDEWDKRIIKTGCSEENFNLQICYADNKDWRKCTKEVSVYFMLALG